MRPLRLLCIVTTLAVGRTATASDPQPPKGEDGLSFRSESFFQAADDFVCPATDPIVAVRWWGSFADEDDAGDHTTGPFRITVHDSAGGLPAAILAEYVVDAMETFTNGSCRGIEGLGGGDVCLGPEPLYSYEACMDPPFVPEAGVEYWISIRHELDDETRYWAWHEAAVDHPAGNEAATFWCIGGCSWSPGLINACPGDFSSLVGPYDLAFELLSECPSDCPADIDGSGAVDFGDILAILSAWGPCKDDCPEDLDGNGDVGFNDLLIVLSDWGPCP